MGFPLPIREHSELSDEGEQRHNTNRENVTAIVTICADGTTLQPTIVFKGKNFMKKWGTNNVAHAS